MNKIPDKQFGNSGAGGDPAADLIRQKINKIYNIKEPTVVDEVEEAFDPGNQHLSKHQRFMRELTNSGKSLADIQTEWHRYYSNLPDNEKHDVWQEFYEEHNRQIDEAKKTEAKEIGEEVFKLPDETGKPVVKEVKSPRTVSDLKSQLLKKPESRARVKLKAKQQFQSILFGLGMGSLVVLILLFSFFNERFIAPFISPSKNVTSTPIIIDGSTNTSDGSPKVIIPKINVEVPVVYDEPSVEEHAIQTALERGVVHYGNTPSPGQIGNVVIFGHSSNNILNHGKYKFAFVLLNRMEEGDTFYLTKDKIRYVYKITTKKIVKPTELGVLNNSDKDSIATLITCDPPGTSLNRLIVIGQQISPDPVANKKSDIATNTAKEPSIIPSNAESLWQRITHIFSN